MLLSWSEVVHEVLFRISSAGPLTTVQDYGRIGFARFGVTAGGPMDRVAHEIGQRILGAHAQGSAIEIDVQGLSLECIEGLTRFVLTGGDFIVAFGQCENTGWTVGTLRAGDSIRIRPNRW